MNQPSSSRSVQLEFFVLQFQFPYSASSVLQFYLCVVQTIHPHLLSKHPQGFLSY